MNAPEMDTPSPVVSKRQGSWDGIKLVHYRFREGDLPEHSLTEHLVTFALGGGCRGEIRTASGFHARGEGQASVCVIPSGQPFSAQLLGETEQLAIHLEPALVLRAADEARPAGGRTVEVIEGYSPNDPVVRSVGLALLGELEMEGPGGRLYAESLANLLAVHLLRHYTSSNAVAGRFKGGLSANKLRRVKAFIADNYESDLSLSELADVTGMSTFHFAREFKRTTGTSPHQYLIKYRIERAKALLSESEMPLVEVSSRLGFSHQSHFTRLFRKLTGTTPLSYRHRFQS
jgi:AraC family transcriptional regulator